MVREVRTALICLGCSLIGVILAAIEYMLYNAGVIIDEFVTGSITLPDLMAFTIIIWVLVGVILGLVWD